MNRNEKVIELKKYILSLDEEQTRYQAGATYSDIVIDGESLCDAKRKHKDQYLRIDKIIESIGDIKGKTFIEFGTCTGYMIFRLKELGASKCVGIDQIYDLLNIANKVNDIEGYSDVNFYDCDFVDAILDGEDFENFDYAITFSCINSIENHFDVSEWLEASSKIAPTMFIEFSEYIINTIWENEFDSLDLETLEPTSKPDRTPFKKDEHEKWKEEKKEVFFQIRTEEMFDKAKYIKSWKNLGMTDYNRRIYRLDFK